LKVPPVVTKATAERAVYVLNWLSATGTSLLLVGILSGLLLGLSFGELVKTFLNTLKRIRLSLVTIAAMLALGFTTRYSDLDASMDWLSLQRDFFSPFSRPSLVGSVWPSPVAIRRRTCSSEGFRKSVPNNSASIPFFLAPLTAAAVLWAK
jgi:hypothetical protein